MNAADRVRARRTDRGWTQAQLAESAGLSRAQVSAIETERSVPSVTAALSLARALDTSVEALFGTRATGDGPAWAWPPARGGSRFWVATVGEAPRRYPVEPTPVGLLPHDGVDASDASRAGGPEAEAPEGGRAGRTRAGGPEAEPDRTLVLAGCDPAAGLLAAELSRGFGVRLLPFARSSLRALELLRNGLVAVAGLHVGRTSDENLATARSVLGGGFHLLRLTTWEAGVAVAPGVGRRSPRALRRARLRWVGRQEGSGAWHCLDELFEGAWESEAGSAPRATDHRGVAEAVRAGWAQAGVCVRLAAEEAGLDFVPLRREAYDLCYPAGLAEDPRIRALRDAVRARRFRSDLGELPGYDAADAGDLRVEELRVEEAGPAADPVATSGGGGA